MQIKEHYSSSLRKQEKLTSYCAPCRGKEKIEQVLTHGTTNLLVQGHDAGYHRIFTPAFTFLLLLLLGQLEDGGTL